MQALAGSGWRSGVYLGQLIVQCAAAVLMVINGLPFYRLVLHLPHLFGAASDSLPMLTLMAALVMQLAYWAGHYVGAVPCVRAGSVLAHLVAFLGRLPFMFGSAVFALLFFVKPPDIALSATELLIVPFALFALYCLSRDLDRFAAAMTAGAE